MIQTYQGYFQEDGRFLTDGLLIKLPTKRRAIVNILDDDVTESHNTSRFENGHTKKTDVIKDILAGAFAAEDSVLSDADWDEMAGLRSRTNAGLSRAIEI